MPRPRATFLKRDREMKLKQRAADKAARKAARQSEGQVGKGPPIDWSSMNEETTETAESVDPATQGSAEDGPPSADDQTADPE